MNTHVAQYRLKPLKNLNMRLNKRQLADAILLDFAEFIDWHPIPGVREQQDIYVSDISSAPLQINIYFNDAQLTVSNTNKEVKEIIEKQFAKSDFVIKDYIFDGTEYIVNVILGEL